MAFELEITPRLTVAHLVGDALALRGISPESRHRMLIALFADTLLSRPTELRALLNLYYRAERDDCPPMLTPRQKQAADLRREALKLGIPMSQVKRVISQQMGISIRMVNY